MSADLVVTGIGVWSAAGTTPEQLWHQALRGTSAAAWHEFDGERFLACLAPDPGPCDEFPRAHRMDRSVRLALAAALPAASMARLEQIDPTRLGVLVGNSRGPAGLLHSPPARRVRPTEATNSAVASLSGALSLALGAQGPCLTVSATCSSSAHAIALAASLIHGGTTDVVVAGGAEAPLVRPLLRQFVAAGLMGHADSPALANRPFDETRNGIVPGEGAAFLVLETPGHARARGARPLATLAGWAMSADSHNRIATRPDGDGLVRAIRQALRIAGAEPDALAHINAHGTGTRVNDAAEAAALHAVFGPGLSRLRISSTKPVTGHTFGATAALEAVLTILALRHQTAPPTTGLTRLDPALGLLPVANRSVAFTGELALSTSLGFWGNAAALLFRNAVGQISGCA